MYKGGKIQARDVDEIKRDIDYARMIYEDAKRVAWTRGYGGDVRYIARAYGIPWLISGEVETVFIGDSDSLIIKTEKMCEILEYLRKRFPSIKRITSYARVRTVLKKEFRDLKRIREAGLTRLHFGLESGNRDVLNIMMKGITPEEAVEAGLKAKEAGFEISKYVIAGLGGEKMWKEHAVDTAEVLNKIDPHFIRVRTLVILPFTPLYELVEKGDFVEANPETILEEQRIMIKKLKVNSEFYTDHVSNYIQLNGKLPEDKEKFITEIDRVLSLPDEIRSRVLKRYIVRM